MNLNLCSNVYSYLCHFSGARSNEYGKL
uniref:Uncharacterized protein n=1 Tax=Arundo donax TaxID=35708 RepID=A0A0A9DNN7_ARUDO